MKTRWQVGVFFLALIFDIFIYPRISDLLVIFLILFWVFNVRRLKIKPTQTLFLGMLSYLISFLAQFFEKEVVVEKGVSWFFIFLTIAIIQKAIKEFSKNE